MPKERLVIVLLLLAALGASLEVWVSTKQGAGISPDSVAYIASARNFNAGEGFTTPTAAGPNLPLIQFPPGYPLLLALCARVFHTSIFTAARWINVVLLGALVALLGLWVFRRTGRWFVAAVVMVLCMSAIDLLRIYSMAWSETSFLFFTFAGLWLMENHLKRSSLPFLMAAALLSAAAWITRYAGVAVVGAGFISLYVCQRKTLAKKVVESVIFMTIAGLPMAGWLVRNTLLTHHATTRVVVFHPMVRQMAEAAAGSLSLGLFQQRHPSAFMTWAGAVVLLIIGLLWKRYRKAGAGPTAVSLPVVFALCYALLMGVTVCFFEAGLLVLDEYDRILSPLHIVLILWIATALSHCDWPNGLQKVLAAAVVLWMGIIGYRGVHEIKELSSDGQQYASQTWRSSPTMAYIRGLPHGLHVYTNGVKPVYLYVNRYCYEIPPKVSANTLQINPNYIPFMGRIRDEVQHGAAVVVYFYEESQEEFPSETELETILHAPNVKTGDAVIFHV